MPKQEANYWPHEMATAFKYLLFIHAISNRMIECVQY